LPRLRPRTWISRRQGVAGAAARDRSAGARARRHRPHPRHRRLRRLRRAHPHPAEPRVRGGRPPPLRADLRHLPRNLGRRRKRGGQQDALRQTRLLPRSERPRLPRGQALPGGDLRLWPDALLRLRADGGGALGGGRLRPCPPTQPIRAPRGSATRPAAPLRIGGSMRTRWHLGFAACFALGGLGLLLGLVLDPRRFFFSYFTAWFYFFTIAAGALLLLMTGHAA